MISSRVLRVNKNISSIRRVKIVLNILAIPFIHNTNSKYAKYHIPKFFHSTSFRVSNLLIPQNYPSLPPTHGARFGYFRSRIIYYSTPNVVGLNKESVALKTYFRRQVLEYPNNKISDSPRPFSRT